jgi:hypothetical protein
MILPEDYPVVSKSELDIGDADRTEAAQISGVRERYATSPLVVTKTVPSALAVYSQLLLHSVNTLFWYPRND